MPESITYFLVARCTQFQQKDGKCDQIFVFLLLRKRVFHELGACGLYENV